MLPCVSFSAFTCVLVGPICALGAIFAGCAGTLVYVYLAQGSGEACGALAEEIVDLVDTFAVVQAWVAGALVCINLTALPFVSWHADALKVSDLVQAGGFVHTGVGHALVDVQLAPGPDVPTQTFTLERAFGVDALSRMFTRIGAQCTLVHVLIT